MPGDLMLNTFGQSFKHCRSPVGGVIKSPPREQIPAILSQLHKPQAVAAGEIPDKFIQSPRNHDGGSLKSGQSNALEPEWSEHDILPDQANVLASFSYR